MLLTREQGRMAVTSGAMQRLYGRCVSALDLRWREGRRYIALAWLLQR